MSLIDIATAIVTYPRRRRDTRQALGRAAPPLLQLDPPLTRLEKAILAVMAGAAFLAGYAYGLWLWAPVQ